MSRLRIYILPAILLSTAALLAQTTQPSFLLHSGDRVVFYGDSITAQRLYTRFAEEFVLTRYPGMDVQFFNAGVSGDTVYGGYAGDTATRLKRDVFPCQPTVMTVMLGMNDAGYVPWDDPIFNAFKTGYKSLLDQAAAGAPGVRFTLIQASPYDEITHGTEFPGLSGTIQRYGQFAADLGKEKGLSVADFNTPVTAALRASMSANPSFASLLIPDRIHPSEMGHWIMAEELMRCWGASPVVSNVRLDAANATVAATENADVSGVQRTANGLKWTTLEHALPLPISAEDPMAKFFFAVGHLGDMDEETLAVRGLTANQYELRIDGKPLAKFTRTELEHGINLAALPTPMLGQASGLHWLEDRRTKQDAARFSLVGEQPNVPGGMDAARTLEAASAENLKQQHHDAQPKPHTFELIAQ